MDIFERYETLCKEVEHQMKFLSDCYQMDFDYLEETLSELKILQYRIREQQFIEYNENKKPIPRTEGSNASNEILT